MNFWKAQMKNGSVSSITTFLIIALVIACSGPKKNALDTKAFSVDLTTDSDAKIFEEDGPLRYPRQALRESKAGFVEVSFVVNKIGRATEIKILREFPEGYGFGNAAINHVKGLRFTPAVLNGERVRQRVQRSYKFEDAKPSKINGMNSEIRLDSNPISKK